MWVLVSKNDPVLKHFSSLGWLQRWLVTRTFGGLVDRSISFRQLSEHWRYSGKRWRQEGGKAGARGDEGAVGAATAVEGVVVRVNEQHVVVIGTRGQLWLDTVIVSLRPALCVCDWVIP